MNLTPDQFQTLRIAVAPLVQWLHNNCHPHCCVRVQSGRVEVTESLGAFPLDFTEAHASKPQYVIPGANSRASQALHDPLTQLGINADEVPEHGGETIADCLARIAVTAAFDTAAPAKSS